MKIGDMTQPLRTPRGYQILKLESSNPTQTLPFDQSRDRIADAILNSKRSREFVKYLADGHDGYDTCAWIIRQAWSNGRIGTMGHSAQRRNVLLCLAALEVALRRQGWRAPASAGVDAATAHYAAAGPATLDVTDSLGATGTGRY